MEVEAEAGAARPRARARVGVVARFIGRIRGTQTRTSYEKCCRLGDGESRVTHALGLTRIVAHTHTHTHTHTLEVLFPVLLGSSVLLFLLPLQDFHFPLGFGSHCRVVLRGKNIEMEPS